MPRNLAQEYLNRKKRLEEAKKKGEKRQADIIVERADQQIDNIINKANETIEQYAPGVALRRLEKGTQGGYPQRTDARRNLAQEYLNKAGSAAVEKAKAKAGQINSTTVKSAYKQARKDANEKAERHEAVNTTAPLDFAEAGRYQAKFLSGRSVDKVQREYDATRERAEEYRQKALRLRETGDAQREASSTTATGKDREDATRFGSSLTRSADQWDKLAQEESSKALELARELGYAKAYQVQKIEADIVSEPDFAQKSEADPKVLELGNEENRPQMSRATAIYGGINNSPYFETRGSETFMADEEVKIFTYLYNTQGEKAAEQYYDMLSDTLELRRGTEKAAGLDNTFERTMFSLSQGVRRFGRGIEQLFTDEQLPLYGEDYAENIINAGASQGERILYSTANSIGNMLPMVAISAATQGIGGAVGLSAEAAQTAGKAASVASMFAGAKGNAYTEAMQQGMTKAQASTYSTLVGASEAGLEYLIGGISRFSMGSGIGDFVQEAISGLGRGYARVAFRFAGSLIGGSIDEIIEENTQNYLEPLFINYVTGKEAEMPGWDDFIETTLSTLITTGVMESRNSFVEAKQNIAFTPFEAQLEWVSAAKNVFAEGTDVAEFADVLESRLQAGDPMSYKEFREGIRALGVDEKTMDRIAKGKLTVDEVLTSTENGDKISLKEWQAEQSASAQKGQNQTQRAETVQAENNNVEAAMTAAEQEADRLIAEWNRGESSSYELGQQAQRVLQQLEEEVREGTATDPGSYINRQFQLQEIVRSVPETSTAQQAAQNTTEGVDNNGRTEILNDGSEWDAGMGTGEQTGGMAAGAAAAEGERRSTYAGAGENGPANRRANLRPEDAARAERLNRYASLQSDTSLAQLVRGGSDAVTLAVVPESMYDDGMRAAKQAGAELGVDVVFVRGSMAMQRGDQLMRINGVYDAAAKRAVVGATDIQYDGGQLAQHELFHARANSDPALVQQALQKVRETFGEEAFEQVAREYVQSYSGAYQSMEDVYEEVLADAYAGMNRFRAGATQFTEAVRGEVQQSERASEPAQTSQETRGSPEGRFSIQELENGERIAVIEDGQDEFDRAKPSQYAAIAKRVIKREFVGKTLPLGSEDLAMIPPDAAGEYAYPAQRLITKNANNAKMRASAELNNLLEVSEFSHWARDLKKHPEATLGFDYYTTKFEVGGHLFEGLINIANSEKGRVFYDITKIKEIPGTIEKRATPMAQSASDSGDLSGESVSQNQADVKQRFSLSEPVERAGNLIAEHNLTQEKLEKALEIGAFPSPSIAIVQAEQGHTNYGDYSVVFPASTIDPEADSRNRVYGADAWTPTSSNAAVEYRVDADAKRAFERSIRDLSGQVADGIFRGDSTLGKAGIEEETTKTSREIAEQIAKYPEVKAAYLADKGENISPVYKDREYDNIGNAALQRYTDNVGVQNLAQIIVQMYMGDANSVAQAELQRVRQAIGEEYAERFARILDRKPERKAERVSEYAENKMYSGTRAEDFIRHAWEMVQDGGQNRGEADKLAMQDELDRKAPTQKVAAWAEKRLQDVIGEGGIYNNEDRYTSRGDRRSFEQTHWELNAENLVRAMAQAEERGANIMWYDAGGLLAAATPEYRSISEIHADEGRLQTLEQEAYEGKVMELQQSLDNVVKRILQETRHKAYGYQDESQLITEALIKTAQGGDSLQSIREGMAAEEYDIDRATAMQIQEVFRQAKEIPTSYFEAKPQRVVSFDEAVALLAPESAPAGLMERAEDAGLRVIRYADNADRIRVANELPGVRFSVADEMADIRENGIRGKELASDREETQPEDVLGSEPVTPESYFRDWVVRPKQETLKWGKDVPLYSDETNLSPRKAVELLEAATGKRWSVQPRKSGGWRAVETKITAKQSAIAPDTAAAQLYAAAEAQKAANKEAYQQGENPKPARSVYAEGIPKAGFRATPALEKIGVKIDMGVTDYRTTKQMRERSEAEYQTNRLIQKAEKRWGATALEKNFARDIAAGRYSYFDIPDTARWDTVTDLANLYIDKRMLGEDLRLQRKAAIRDNLLYKAMELLPDELELMQDPNAFNKEALLIMNYRTPQRSMLKMFGDKRGEEINRYYFDPVTRNEAERLRWMNRQFDSVREFEGADGKTKELNKAESAYVHMLLDIESTQQRINSSEKKSELLKAAEELQKMETEQKTAPNAEAREAAIQRTAADYDLNAAESRWAQQYASFLAAQKGFRSAGEIDEKRTTAAAEAYRKHFDDYYDAIADFMVSHGDEPIGKVDFYAPHMTTADKVNLLNSAFEALGFNASATRLPAEIAGRTEDFRPNKRWTPFFQSRTGSKTDYDIVEGFESYVTYVSDVLFHTDDIMKIRQLENFARLGGRSNETNALADAIELSRSGKRDEKLDFLREMKIFDDFSEPTDAQIREGLDTYIQELISGEKNSTRYSDFAVWLKNYGDVLAGKQFGGDRGAEHRGGRGILRMGTKLAQSFAKANVAGNVSSAANQIAQLPTILAERSKRSVAQATAEFTTGKLKAFAEESDFITGKKGAEYISNSVTDKLMTGLFKPAEFVDGMMSTIAARAAYLDAIRDGKTHEEAMRAADQYARSIMGDRTKGTKPLMFQSKTPVMQMINMFQIEALNSWEHISQDLPREFRQIERESGKAKAARHLAAVALKTVLAAFVVNRITEELYGGTPAPFDVIGMSANFVASGEGLTTNDWIRSLLNKASNAMFGAELFDDVPEAQEDFDVGSAVGDTVWNISNEIPFLSNVSGLMGLGDRTMPMPDLYGATSDIWNAASKNGVISPETGEAMLGLLTQVIPGGRQIKKTYSGAKTLIEGGKTTGFGERQRLQYPVDRNVGTILQNLLFGPNATQDASAYWASGQGSLSPHDTQTWQTLAGDGADSMEVYNLLHKAIKINADDTLTTAEAQRDIRDAISESSLTDEQKAYLFRQEFGKRNAETGEYEHTTDAMFEALMSAGVSWDGVMDFYNTLQSADADEETTTNEKNRTKRNAIRQLDVADGIKAYTYAEVFGTRDAETGQKTTSKDELFAELMDAGMSWGDIMEVYEEYRALYEDETLSTSQQATEFAYWLDGQGLTKQQRQIVNDGLKYYQMFAQQADRYSGLTEAGLSSSDAKRITDSMANAKGTGKDGQLTTEDKVNVLLKQKLSDASLYKALGTVLAEDAFDKLTEAKSAGISAKTWVQYWQEKAGISSDKDASGKAISGSKKAKILALINSLQITAAQKDMLYRAEGYAERDINKAPWH